MGDHKQVLELLNNLNFEEMIMDTTLAENYLKKLNNEFHPYPRPTAPKYTEYTRDTYGNKVYCTPSPPQHASEEIVDIFHVNQLSKLANKIKENADLFAQLEHLIRKVPQSQVKENDIILIVNHLEWARKNYTENIKELPEYDFPEYINMSNNAPLCLLGVCAQSWLRHQSVIIQASPNTVAIVTLFVELCLDSGINKAMVRVFSVDEKVVYSVNEEGSYIFPRYTFVDDKSGTMAVCTQYADVDSAIDMIFSATATYTYPWRLRRVIIQENVYEYFKKTFTYKVNLLNRRTTKEQETCSIIELVNQTSTLPMEEGRLAVHHMITKSDSVSIYKDKIVMFNYSGGQLHDCLPIVSVETYRTTKELICLIKKYEPRYLSMWCNNMSTANEIAFGTNVTNIWLNDYNVFRIGKCTAETFYGLQILNIKSVCTNEIKGLKKLLQMWSDWKKMSIENRKLAVNNVIQKFVTVEGVDGLLKEKVCDLAQVVRGWTQDSSVVVDNGNMCQQIWQPRGIVLFVSALSHNFEENIAELVKSVLNGNSILLTNILADDCVLLDLFTAEGVPLGYYGCTIDLYQMYSYVERHLKDVDCVLVDRCVCKRDLYNPKTIWSRFGETFAN